MTRVRIPNRGKVSNLSQYVEDSMSPKKAMQKSGESTTAINKKRKGFTNEERGAMKDRAQELKAEARRGPRANKADGESDVLAKIAEMPKPDRAMAERLHAIIKASAPALSPRTWYGMPAYAKDDKVVCFFQSAQKFKTRYATFGFSDKARTHRVRGSECRAVFVASGVHEHALAAILLIEFAREVLGVASHDRRADGVGESCNGGIVRLAVERHDDVKSLRARRLEPAL